MNSAVLLESNFKNFNDPSSGCSADINIFKVGSGFSGSFGSPFEIL